MTHRFYRFVSVAVVLLATMSPTLAATQVSGQTNTLVNADANGVGLQATTRSPTSPMGSP